MRQNVNGTHGTPFVLAMWKWRQISLKNWAKFELNSSKQLYTYAASVFQIEMNQINEEKIHLGKTNCHVFVAIVMIILYAPLISNYVYKIFPSTFVSHILHCLIFSFFSLHVVHNEKASA